MFIVLLLVALPATAFAHERRTLAGGKYDVVVGWDVEPAYQGQKNGATIRISQAGTTPAVPVEGADKTLKVQIRQGAQTREFPLRAVFGQAGYYMADIVPTRAGDYVWTFVGSINADQVNEKFDSADGKFDSAAADLRATMTVTTASDGGSLLRVDLNNTAGVERVRIRLSRPDLGEDLLDTHPSGDGGWVLDGNEIALPGDWHAVVIARRTNIFDDAQGTFGFTVDPSSGTPAFAQASVSPAN